MAAFKSHKPIVRILAKAGADMNALDGDDYDVVTIGAVANDADMLRLALSLLGDPKNITSPYESYCQKWCFDYGWFRVSILWDCWSECSGR